MSAWQVEGEDLEVLQELGRGVQEAENEIRRRQTVLVRQARKACNGCDLPIEQIGLFFGPKGGSLTVFDQATHMVKGDEVVEIPIPKKTRGKTPKPTNGGDA